MKYVFLTRSWIHETTTLLCCSCIRSLIVFLQLPIYITFSLSMVYGIMGASLYVCIHACMHECMQECTYISVYVCTLACMHVSVCIYVSMDVYIVYVQYVLGGAP